MNIFDWRLTVLSAAAISIDSCFRSSLVGLELGNLGAIHMLHHLIRLPLLEAEANALMRIVLVIRLVLVILDANEVGIDGRGIK